jgi:hypothetical protein
MLRIRTNVEAIQRDWEVYQAAVDAIAIGDVASYQRVNQRLGYPLAKSLPALMVLLKRAESDRDTYKTYLDKMKEKLATTQQEVKQLKALMEQERQAENAAAALTKGAKKKGDEQS